MYHRTCRTVLSVLVSILILLPIPVFAADSGAGTMRNYVRTRIAPGFVFYARSYGEDDGTRQNGFSLELSPNQEVYPIVMACDTIWGGMTMDAVVSYAQSRGYNVVGAVNAAFFNDPGVPIGIVVENGKLRSSDNGLNAFAILEDGSYYAVKDPEMEIFMEHPAWETEAVEVDRINKLYDNQLLQLYTSDYSTVSTRVPEEETVWVVRMRIEEGTLRLNGTVHLTVTEILPEANAVPIGEEYMVLTASAEGPYGELWQQFAVGDTLTVRTSCADETLNQAAYIVGCGDILVENGKITDASDWMYGIAGPNPRTMVGWRADGTLVMYVAEGRNPGVSDGLTLQMAAEEMLRQGCVYAVNMDGGGSSILGVRRPGDTMVTPLNTPSAGAQRQDAAYILLVTDQASDGIIKNWHLRQDRLRVLPGQHVSLSAYGTDRALYPVESPPLDLFYGDARGVMKDNVYVAPQEGGRHIVSIWGGGGYGEGEIEVISNPSVVKIMDMNGRIPVEVNLTQGETLELRVRASKNGQVILADHTAIRYEMSAPLGYVNEDGKFTADAPVGTSGILTMRIGNYSQQMRVNVVNSLTDPMEHRVKTAIDYWGKVS